MNYLFNLFCIITYGLCVNFINVSRRRRNKIFCWLAGFHITAIHALRHPFIFSDNEAYSDAYTNIMDYSLYDATLGLTRYTQWGQGYVFYNWLLTNISNNYELLFLTSGLFISGFMVFLIYKWSYNPFLSVLLWLLHPMLFYQSMYVLRQHMASILLLLALYSCRNKIKSATMLIIAFLFHYSAIVFLPFFLLRKYRFEEFKSIKFIILGGLMILLMRLSVDFFVSLFPRFDYEDVGSRNIVPLLIVGSLLLMHVLNGTFSKRITDDDKIILQFLIYGVVMSIFIIGLPGGGRLSNYIIYIVPFATPILFKYGNKLRPLNNLYVFLLLGLFVFLTFNMVVFNSFIDYSFFFETPNELIGDL